MMKNAAIQTPIGVLNGRDAIYLVRQDFDGKRLTIRVKVNGALATMGMGRDWIPAELRFEAVREVRIFHVDSYPGELSLVSSFDAVENCFVVATYDWVFEVVTAKAPEFRELPPSPA